MNEEGATAGWRTHRTNIRASFGRVKGGVVISGTERASNRGRTILRTVTVLEAPIAFSRESNEASPVGHTSLHELGALVQGMSNTLLAGVTKITCRSGIATRCTCREWQGTSRGRQSVASEETSSSSRERTRHCRVVHRSIHKIRVLRDARRSRAEYQRGVCSFFRRVQVVQNDRVHSGTLELGVLRGFEVTQRSVAFPKVVGVTLALGRSVTHVVANLAEILQLLVNPCQKGERSDPRVHDSARRPEFDKGLWFEVLTKQIEIGIRIKRVRVGSEGILIGFKFAQEVSKRSSTIVFDDGTTTDVIKEVPRSAKISPINAFEVFNGPSIVSTSTSNLVYNETQVGFCRIEGLG